MLDEESYIGGCLDSILGGEFLMDHYEVLVVDGGAVDRSEIVRGNFLAQ